MNRNLCGLDESNKKSGNKTAQWSNPLNFDWFPKNVMHERWIKIDGIFIYVYSNMAFCTGKLGTEVQSIQIKEYMVGTILLHESQALLK